jgi:hypothetical protein
MLKNDLLDKLHRDITKSRDDAVNRIAYTTSTQLHEITFLRGWLKSLDDVLVFIEKFDAGIESK